MKYNYYSFSVGSIYNNTVTNKKLLIAETLFFLSVCPKSNFGSVNGRQPHSPDVNYCTSFISFHSKVPVVLLTKMGPKTPSSASDTRRYLTILLAPKHIFEVIYVLNCYQFRYISVGKMSMLQSF